MQSNTNSHFKSVDPQYTGSIGDDAVTNWGQEVLTPEIRIIDLQHCDNDFRYT